MPRRLRESLLRLLAAATLACTITGCRVATAALPTETPTTMPVVRYTPTQMPTLEEPYAPEKIVIPTATYTPTPFTPTPTPTATPTSTPTYTPVPPTATPTPSNPVVKYASKSLPHPEAERFKPLGEDGSLDPNDKILVDQYVALLEYVRAAELTQTKLHSIIRDGKVVDRELNDFKDLDGDRFLNLEEIEFDSDPVTPNPVLGYALLDLKLPREEDLIQILLPLDRDGEMDDMDKAFVDWSKDYVDWSKVKGFLYYVTQDGRVTEDEVSLIDTVSIIPTLIPEFKALEKIPGRVYQGRDLSGWETIPSEYEKGKIVTIEDVDAIHYGDYSEIRSNVRMRCIMPLAASYFKKSNEEKLYDYIHISGYKIRIPFTPRADEKQELNSEIIGGGFQTFNGPNATGYDIGWGWTLNPWSECYGCINVWEMTSEYPETPVVDRVTPDKNWHSLIFILDKKNDHGYVLFDSKAYEVDEILRSYHPEWKGESIDGGLVVEVSNAYPSEACYRNMGILQVKDWFWVWIHYNTYQ